MVVWVGMEDDMDVLALKEMALAYVGKPPWLILTWKGEIVKNSFDDGSERVTP